jgi:hypothetical protein
MEKSRGSREKEKHLLFSTQEMGAETQNGGSRSVVLYFSRMEDFTLLEIRPPKTTRATIEVTGMENCLSKAKFTSVEGTHGHSKLKE